MLVVLLVVSFLSIAVGARSVGLGVVVDALRGHDAATSDHQVIVNRIPRLLAGLLVGAAVSAALTSLTNAVLLTDTATFDQQRFWTVGSLTGRRLDLIAQLAPFVLVGIRRRAVSVVVAGHHEPDGEILTPKDPSDRPSVPKS